MDLYEAIEMNFPKIEKLFTESMRIEFLQLPLVYLEKYAGLGTMIRRYLLRPDSALYQEFIKNRFTDENEMTMEIIREFYRHIYRST